MASNGLILGPLTSVEELHKLWLGFQLHPLVSLFRKDGEQSVDPGGNLTSSLVSEKVLL